MDLTTLDRELLDGLRVLTDLEISRVQAHLAAGLPMRIAFGWEPGIYDQPACFGCVVGVAMSDNERSARVETVGWKDLYQLSHIKFPTWAAVQQGWADRWPNIEGTGADRLSPATLTRLAALLDMEWSRRVMATSNPVEQTHDSAIIPSLEAVPVG